MAFQLRQTLALATGKEIYTKEEIAGCYPQLSAYLQREAGTATEELTQLLHNFISRLEERMPTMRFTEEEAYGTT